MGKIKNKIESYLNHKIGYKNFDYDQFDIKEDYVSFDIFDTLIVRDVQKPTDVFWIMEKIFKESGFYKKRITAEKKARDKKENGEVTIKDIYENFEGISKEEVDVYCKRELDFELTVCRINYRIFEFYKKCLKNKKVILVSDMYFPKCMMKKILRKCGIYGYEKLYISCEVGETKHGSGLYEYILSDLNIKANQILHIGNDFVSDKIRANSIGIRSIKLLTNTRNVMVNGILADNTNIPIASSMVYQFINNTTCSDSRFEDFYFRFGYENFGVFLWGFNKWLIERMEKKGIEQVLFLSRDGYIIKKAYELMGFSKRIPAYYLEISRRSILVPVSLSESIDYSESIKLIYAVKKITLKQIFDTWGLNSDDYIEQIKKVGLSQNTYFWKKDLAHNRRVKMLYESIKYDILKNAKDESAAMERYLDKFNFNKKTALVDIGYGGTIQKELLKEFNKRNIKSDIYGYYMIFDKERLMENTDGNGLNIEGYIWSDLKNNWNSVDRYQYVGLFETLFLEQIGSVKRYISKNSSICIERYKYEYDCPGGEKNETELVSNIQEGALCFIRNTNSSIIKYLKHVDKDVSFGYLDRILSHPTEDVIKHFYNFRFFDRGQAGYLAKPKMNFWGYFLHLRKFKSDFYSSMWKVGFLYKLFGFNIFYKEIKAFYYLIKRYIRHFLKENSQ